MTHRAHYNVYIASCHRDGGIFHYHLLSDGTLKYQSYKHMDRPMYMNIHNNKMYVLLRECFERGESGLTVCPLSEDGSLQDPSEILSTKGKIACHLLVDGNDVYCTNYSSGSIIKMPGQLVLHSGKGINKDRQEKPHPHFVGITPDGKYVCVADLGLDKIFIYTKDLEKAGSVDVPKGHGPRHLVYSKDGKTCFSVNELESTVTAFHYEDGRLTALDTASCLPEGFAGISTASAIRYCEGLVYVSNRGHNSISVLQFTDGKLQLIRSIDCLGDFPRDFEITGDFILSANEKSHTVSVIDRNSMKPTDVIKNITSPVCVIYTVL